MSDVERLPARHFDPKGSKWFGLDILAEFPIRHHRTDSIRMIISVAVTDATTKEDVPLMAILSFMFCVDKRVDRLVFESALRFGEVIQEGRDQRTETSRCSSGTSE
jgi:hypothetical protein